MYIHNIYLICRLVISSVTYLQGLKLSEGCVRPASICAKIKYIFTNKAPN